jgi:hypothetical protein
MVNDYPRRGYGGVWAVIVAGLCLTISVTATETQHYAYNSRGELRSVARSGGANDGFKSAYTLDNAANRTRVDARDVRVWLGAGMSIASQDGRFQLVMQTDGNLVLYGPAGALWWTSSNGPGRTMLFQSDGNLVVYGPTGAVWAINQQNWGAEMTLQNDGNLVIRAEDGRIVWQTGTGGH